MVDADVIDGLLDELRRAYGAFPVETAEYQLTTEAYTRARELHDAGVPGATRVWVERGDETLLVREERRPDSWGVPDGLIESGESPAQAGEREVREETGIECKIIDVAYVHRAMEYHEDGEGEPLVELAVAFIAEYVSGEITPQDGEIRDAAWWSSLPNAVHSPADRIATDRFE